MLTVDALAQEGSMTHTPSTPANPAQGVSTADLRERLAEVEAIIAELNDELALIDWISDKIGLPHDEELTRENFAQYLTAAIGAGGQAVAVKPLDLSNLLKHAFSAGYVSAAGDDGWTDYDPTKCAAYSRILSAIAHPVQPGWRLMPEKLTDAMVRELERGEQDGYRVVWPDVLSAAPQPKGE